MLRRNIVLSIAIRPSDGDIKPGGPLGAFRAGTGFHLLSSFHHHHLLQHNYSTQSYPYSHPNLNFLQHYTDTLPTRNVVCPRGAWFENRPHSMPFICLVRNPKRVIVQWVGIRNTVHRWSVFLYVLPWVDLHSVPIELSGWEYILQNHLP